VPMFMCGLVRSNFFLATVPRPASLSGPLPAEA
jgi:hypothetical protein